MRRLLVLLTLLLGAGCSSRPQEPSGPGCADQSASSSVLATVALGSARDLEVHGRFAYVAAWIDGLRIVDVSTPSSPRAVGQASVSEDVASAAMGLTVSGSNAYVAVGDRGLAIVDVRDPAQPRIVVPTLELGDALDVVVTGVVALVTTRSSLVAVDVSDPASPSILDTLALELATIGGRVVVRGNLAFVVNGIDRMFVVSLEDPENLAPVASLTFAWGPRWIVVAGDHGFVTDSGSGLQVVDLTNPLAPSLLGRVVTRGDAQGLWVESSQAYVADRIGGVQAIDVSNPEQPRIVGWLRAPGEAEAASVSGRFLLVANLQEGLQALDTRSLLPAYASAMPANANGFSVDGSRMYVAALGDGLQILDVADPAAPRWLADVKTHSTAVTVADGAVLAADLSGFFAYDMQNPGDPVLLDALLFEGGPAAYFPSDVHYRAPYAFLADRAQGLVVIDVTDPSDLAVVATLPTPGVARRVLLDGEVAYLADGPGGVARVDVSDPRAPVARSSVATTDARDVQSDGALLFVADGDAGLKIFDVTDFEVPRLEATMDTPGTAIGVRVEGDVAYVADAEGGVQIVRVRPVGAARRLGSVATPGQARLAQIVDGRLYIADSRVGVMSLEVPCQ